MSINCIVANASNSSCFLKCCPTPEKVQKIGNFICCLKKDFKNIQTGLENATWLVSNANVIFNKTALENATWLVCNANTIFNSACVNLHRVAILFVVVSLLTAVGGLGAAFCPKEYKKTRFAFICMTLISTALSIFTSIALFKIHTEATTYQCFFDRRWG